MKAPSVSPDAGGVFQSWEALAQLPGSEPLSAGFSPERDFVMPVWMEVLLNVIGYAGFVGIATFNRSAEEPPHAREESVS
jgi:hypothetical protein